MFACKTRALFRIAASSYSSTTQRSFSYNLNRTLIKLYSTDSTQAAVSTESASPPIESASTPIESASTPIESASTPTESASTPTESASPSIESASTSTESASPSTEPNAKLDLSEIILQAEFIQKKAIANSTRPKTIFSLFRPATPTPTYSGLLKALKNQNFSRAYTLYLELQNNYPELLKSANATLYDDILGIINLPQKNVVSDPTIITRASRTNNVYRFMQKQKVDPKMSSFETITYVNSKTKNRIMLDNALEHIERLGLTEKMSIKARANFVYGYITIGDEAQGIHHFKKMCEISRNTFPYKVLIDAYAHTNQPERLFKIIDAMKRSDHTKPNIHCYFPALLCYYRKKDFAKMQELIDDYMAVDGTLCEPLLYAQLLISNHSETPQKGFDYLSDIRNTPFRNTSRVEQEEIICHALCNQTDDMWRQYADQSAHSIRAVNRLCSAMVKAIGSCAPSESSETSNDTLDAIKQKIKEHRIRPRAVYTDLLAGYTSQFDHASVKALIPALTTYQILSHKNIVSLILQSCDAAKDFAFEFQLFQDIIGNGHSVSFNHVVKLLRNCEQSDDPAHAKMVQDIYKFAARQYPNQKIHKLKKDVKSESIKADHSDSE
ncbi:hypothetical protein BDV3_003753 [Batrachochytrium dendrobatidis]